jgi:tetratricopeptide (TPR) repeat protein
MWKTSVFFFTSRAFVALLLGAQLLAQQQTWKTGWEIHNTAGKEAYLARKYTAAISEFQAAVKDAEKDSSKDAKECLAASLTNLGEVYTETKQYDNAAATLTRAAQLWRATAGVNSINYAVGLRDLAVLRENQKQYAEAQRLFQQALTITQAALGTQHPSTATLINDLGVLD